MESANNTAAVANSKPAAVYYKWKWIWSEDNSTMIEGFQKFTRELDCRLAAEKVKPSYTSWDGAGAPSAELVITAFDQGNQPILTGKEKKPSALYPMQRERLLHIRETAKKELRVDRLLTFGELWTQQEVEQLKTLETQEEKASQMIDFLLEKDTEVFNRFTDILKFFCWELRDKLLVLKRLSLSQRTELQIRLGKWGKAFLAVIRKQEGGTRYFPLSRKQWLSSVEHRHHISEAVARNIDFEIPIGVGEFIVVKTYYRKSLIGFHKKDSYGRVIAYKTMNFEESEWEYLRLFCDVIAQFIENATNGSELVANIQNALGFDE